MPRLSAIVLASVSALALTFVVGCASESEDGSTEGIEVEVAPATVETRADGAASSSAPSFTCAPGYYRCWSNVQQKSVCTTRRCY